MPTSLVAHTELVRPDCVSVPEAVVHEAVAHDAVAHDAVAHDAVAHDAVVQEVVGREPRTFGPSSVSVQDLVGPAHVSADDGNDFHDVARVCVCEEDEKGKEEEGQ